MLARQTATRAEGQEGAVGVDPFKVDVGCDKAGERANGKKRRPHCGTE
jgi:hypothetical protein